MSTSKNKTTTTAAGNKTLLKEPNDTVETKNLPLEASSAVENTALLTDESALEARIEAEVAKRLEAKSKTIRSRKLTREELRAALTTEKGPLYLDPRHKEDGYTYRFVKIGEGNEAVKEKLGYEPVYETAENGKEQQVRRAAKDGKGGQHVLMRIDNETKALIEQIKAEERNQIDRALKADSKDIYTHKDMSL